MLCFDVKYVKLYNKKMFNVDSNKQETFLNTIFEEKPIKFFL